MEQTSATSDGNRDEKVEQGENGNEDVLGSNNEEASYDLSSDDYESADEPNSNKDEPLDGNDEPSGEQSTVNDEPIAVPTIPWWSHPALPEKATSNDGETPRTRMNEISVLQESDSPTSESSESDNVSLIMLPVKSKDAGDSVHL